MVMKLKKHELTTLTCGSVNGIGQALDFQCYELGPKCTTHLRTHRQTGVPTIYMIPVQGAELVLRSLGGLAATALGRVLGLYAMLIDDG
jgi:hypothetical protein